MLWPSLQRDFLLSLAIEGLYRPLWSDVLLDEVEDNEAAKLVRRGALEVDAAARASFLRVEMVRAFPDAIVTGFEPLEGSFGLPDPDDEHVLAAAVLGGAGAIVTFNFKDFPAKQIPAGIEIISPERFTADTVTLDPPAALRALQQISCTQRTTRTARQNRGGAQRHPDRLLQTRRRDGEHPRRDLNLLQRRPAARDGGGCEGPRQETLCLSDL
ncbi:hypothetical protein O159_13660 [Leifsonia xyli subsp. cynodontis DSM 46306]|uniref:PIN domain-containing protein n=1 Tax=Leifsonia xyli subsp. cynodontis DSM 46306 TaxID=1389489 RepID=U3P556_LEIXC|nr:hypothetical protein O159_13660 [Leifsonia xyli subsp. cynodontis DSM 46306]